MTATTMLRSLGQRALQWARQESGSTESDEAKRQQPLPVGRIAAQAVGIWLGTRLALALITIGAAAFDNAPHAPTILSIFPATPRFAPYLEPYLTKSSIWGAWVHWDASWYLLIALHGYDINTPVTAGFFPLYPLAIHLLTLIVGKQAVLPVALTLSNLAALAAFIGLGLLGAHEAQAQAQRRSELADGPTLTRASGWLIGINAAYPFAFFLFAPFTESFFLALLVFSFFSARRGHWGWAAALALLAGLTRPTALALVPALFWEYGRQHGLWQWKFWQAAAWRARAWLGRMRALGGSIGMAAAAPAGLGLFMFFLFWRYGDGWYPWIAQVKYHGRVNWPIWRTAGLIIQRITAFPTPTPQSALLYVDGALVIIFLALAFVNIPRLPVFYSLYLFATLAILLSSPAPYRLEVVPSVGRYLLMATPIFLGASRWAQSRPWIGWALVAGGLMLQGFFALLFLSGVWIE